ncbi:hypothetical protein ACIQRS_18840 [Streptomyces termitum]|uniref:Uncharacterized protein n=1 Tax=Streptomyces termitum TaxID=67368 RepID=A0A918WCL5_9ACTN|nr:hypothetical protein [Streptomyces termitum]GHA94925.1 hypothetical protein GCM10010305_43160 [Streptomyces termitum]
MTHSPQRSWFARHKVLTAAGAVVAVVVIGTAVGGGGEDPKAPEAKSSAPASSGAGKSDAGKSGSEAPASKAPEKKKAATIDGDGDFEVGADVKPGLYRSTGNEDAGCYWERSKDAKGELDSILANDNVTGTSYVEVLKTDKLFKSTGCGTWEAVDPKAAGTPGTTLKGDGGMFKVGVDVAPGTYRSTGNKDAGCYWERSKDAAHGINSILANDNATGTAIVRIGAKDGYFKSVGCGDWTKTS